MVPRDVRIEDLCSESENYYLVHQVRMTHNILINSVVFARGRLIYEVMSRAVDAEHKTFLERPSGDIKRKLFIS